MPDADVFKIEPLKPYSNNYMSCIEQAKEDLRKNLRPPLKENVISTFATIGACLVAVANLEIGGLDIIAEDGVDAVQAMILATNISVPALISFIAFNMTTIPCFAAVGTARAELSSSKSFKGTILFWLISSYVISMMVYTIGSWWWTLFLWAIAITILIFVIKLKNKNQLKIKV